MLQSYTGSITGWKDSIKQILNVCKDRDRRVNQTEFEFWLYGSDSYESTP